MDIQLSDQARTFIESQLSSGKFRTATEVIDALIKARPSGLPSWPGKVTGTLRREEIDEDIDKPQETCYDIAKRLGAIGMIKDSPPDLSTNKKYMEGFGRDDGSDPY